jgi:hypothetical protein
MSESIEAIVKMIITAEYFLRIVKIWIIHLGDVCREEKRCHTWRLIG